MATVDFHVEFETEDLAAILHDLEHEPCWEAGSAHDRAELLIERLRAKHSI